MVALGRKYDTGIFLSPTNETCFLCLYTCYLDEDYVPRYARNCVLYKERLKSSLKLSIYGRYWDFIKQYEVSLSWMFNDILNLTI